MYIVVHNGHSCSLQHRHTDLLSYCFLLQSWQSDLHYQKFRYQAKFLSHPLDGRYCGDGISIDFSYYVSSGPFWTNAGGIFLSFSILGSFNNDIDKPNVFSNDIGHQVSLINLIKFLQLMKSFQFVDIRRLPTLKTDGTQTSNLSKHPLQSLLSQFSTV